MTYADFVAVLAVLVLAGLRFVVLIGGRRGRRLRGLFRLPENGEPLRIAAWRLWIAGWVLLAAGLGLLPVRLALGGGNGFAWVAMGVVVVGLLTLGMAFVMWLVVAGRPRRWVQRRNRVTGRVHPPPT